MPTLHVCSLARLEETVTRTGARHIVTLINADTRVIRPAEVAEDNHLFLGMNDITTPVPGMAPPGEHHVRSLLEFVAAWDRTAPLVIHCWAGVSRSTAAACITAAALAPERSETEITALLRARSPSATPNRRLIEIADRLLHRDGRLLAAVDAIGRGADAFEGHPFELPLHPVAAG